VGEAFVVWKLTFERSAAMDAVVRQWSIRGYHVYLIEVFW
jgi:hypothetical protein